MNEPKVSFEPDDEDGLPEVKIIGDGDFGSATTPKPKDTFTKAGQEVRKLKGLGTNTKRRISRKINKLHTGEEEAESKQKYPKELSGYALFDVVTPPYNLDYLAKLHEISSPHRAAIEAKASNIVGLGWRWELSLKTEEKLRQIEDDEEKVERAQRKIRRGRHELENWLERLNDEDTFDEILHKVWVDYETMGNGYLEIGRKNNGAIGYMGHIPANTMRKRLKRDGYVQIVDEKVTFFRNYGGEEPDPIGEDPNPNEVIHFMKYAAGNSYYGLPDILAAKQAVAGNEFAARFNLDYFEHKAVPRYIVILKGAKLSPEAEQKIVNFLSGIKGTHHRTLYIPLPGDRGDQKIDFKMEAVEANIQDSSFSSYIEHNREDILIAHRVPMTKVGITQDVNLAVARDSDKNFKEQVTRPAQRVVEKKLTHLFHEVTDAFEFRLNELTLTDEDTKSRIHERYLRWGAMEINEVREDLDLPKTDDGDRQAEQSSQRRAEQQAQGRGSRRRDQEREGGPDNSGEGRAAPGEPRQSE